MSPRRTASGAAIPTLAARRRVSEFAAELVHVDSETLETVKHNRA
jgi:hypothetical protein